MSARKIAGAAYGKTQPSAVLVIHRPYTDVVDGVARVCVSATAFRDEAHSSWFPDMQELWMERISGRFVAGESRTVSHLAAASLREIAETRRS